ncbi:MAG: prephenate dehydrogenase [Gemmatimonadota bacterium]
MPPDPLPSLPRRVAILGLGVMGGSLARALAATDHPPQRTGWSPDPAEGEAARKDGALDRVAPDPEAAVADVDLVVLAAPLAACLALVPRVLDAMPPSAVLTDVASLKADMEMAAAQAGALDRWVGSHPMCGRAASGYAASDPALFRGARVWMVAHERAEAASIRVDALWTAVGARTERTSSAEHDTLMALVSHLPQLTANALAAVLQEAEVDPAHLGSGGRDMTRLAVSSPAMWRDLLTRSDPALPRALRLLARRCGEIAELVEKRQDEALAAWMERTRTWRDG